MIVPNGICHDEINSVRPIERSQYKAKFIPLASFDDHTKIVVTMGRLHKKKGFDYLINAFGMLLRDADNTILLIAGNDDGERANLEDIVDKLKIRGKVHFTGAVEGKEKYVHGTRNNRRRDSIDGELA